jgi:predicted ATPase
VKHILTGTPGSGKTAILRLLETRGHAVVEEAATDVIALENALGNAEPWRDPAFIDKILTLQRSRENTVATGTVFFDRSPVCTLALSRFLGYPASPLLVSEVDRITTAGVYEPTVFFVRNQGYVEPTAARRISYEESLAFEKVHEEAYVELGFHITDIPAGPLPERAALIERALKNDRHNTLTQGYPLRGRVPAKSFSQFRVGFRVMLVAGGGCGPCGVGLWRCWCARPGVAR